MINIYKELGLNKLVINTTAAVLSILCLGTSAQAAVLDFSELPNGFSHLSSLHIGDASLDIAPAAGTQFFIYSPPDGVHHDVYGGVCAINSNYDCQTDWTMTFDFAVTNLTFESDGYDLYDLLEIQYFNGTTLLGSVTVDGNAAFDFGSAVITSLFFDDSSGGQGFSFGEFQYDEASAVPVPAAVWLFGSGLIGLIGVARRKKS